MCLQASARPPACTVIFVGQALTEQVTPLTPHLKAPWVPLPPRVPPADAAAPPALG